jgi:class 3 adenylate cyclase
MTEQQELSPEHLKSLLAKIDPSVLQQLMPLTGGVVTMMFTDIVNSTAIQRRRCLRRRLRYTAPCAPICARAAGFPI